VFTQPGYRRPLHWVFKVGDLKASLDFYERVFGMKARRQAALGSAQRTSHKTVHERAAHALAGAPPRGVRLRLRGDLQRAVRRRVEQDDGAQRRTAMQACIAPRD
jgi:catechol 2,3-dioxygenase-like lactoylglutathione lyase family enzyme